MPERSPTFQERIDSLVGVAMGPGATGPDPVNLPMIRHWVAAFDDHDPVYLDADAASSRFGEVVAPPMMLQTWAMPTPVIDGIAERGGSPTPIAEASPLAVFDEAGFTGTLATDSELEIEQYLHLGDVVSSTNTMESISEEKQTRLGPGHFVTWVTTYRDQHGEVVGRQRFRVLKFKPGGGSS